MTKFNNLYGNAHVGTQSVRELFHQINKITTEMLLLNARLRPLLIQVEVLQNEIESIGEGDERI